MPKLEPASIRYKNPGAMWGDNAISRKWGQIANHTMNDGLGQGNKCAEFPDFLHGAAAQFDLWRTKYCNMTLEAAIHKWSGENSSSAYARSLFRATGLNATSLIDPTTLASSTGWHLMKAQAQWEAGKQYPMTDTEWLTAQSMCFSTKKPMSTTAKKTGAIATAIVVGAPVVQGVAHAFHWGWAVAAVVVIVAVAAGVYAYLHKGAEGAIFNHRGDPKELDLHSPQQ